ncbi:MAG TPA: aminotransferase class V-fold PLP-dependent enzyme [Longimicrobium sp.]|jgi:selenocysteine lyase/cysteine desulfurase
MTLTRRGFVARLGAAAAAAALPPELAASTDLRLPADGGRDFWRTLRGEFLIPRDEAFFNAGTLGASPRAVLQAVVDHMTHVERDLAHWDYHPDHERFYTGYYPELPLRAKLGQVIGAGADEVALTANATMGMNLVANGLELEPGGEVLATEGAHVGCRTGWELRGKRHGVGLRWLKPPAEVSSPAELIDLYERGTTPATRVWVIEHLTSATGVLYPVHELCRRARERGIFTVVDGAQTAGHLVVDVRAMGCDAFYSSPHKWLLAPVGTGFLYVRRESLPRLWTTLASEHWDDQAGGAFRLMQQGTANLSLWKGVEKAVDFHLALGPARVQARALELAGRLRAGLADVPRVRVTSPTHPEMLTGTTLWQVEGLTGRQLQDRLWETAKVRVRTQGPTVRQCCHVYNLEHEVDRTLDAARRIARAA